jgi:alkyl sulfatase BDS1-like metallo-beta-lactamase superfamily hydrolase
MHYGLFKVTDRIYQVRGYDLSNITFIQGGTGWIVLDPLISAEAAKAAFELVTENLGKKPIHAVIYSHSHIDHYGGVRGIVDEAEVKSAHHWPMWGNEKIIDYWKKQRDLYKYIHDQSVRLLNEGYTGVELSNMIKLPPELDQQWYNRGYYGTVKHNTRAVYQRYMGFYDANPTTLDQLPPEEAAKKYVEYMGGADAIIGKAKADFDKGEYRWVAEALKQVVFADPDNKEGKELLADAYEQMGYQAESGPWRSIYLQGAYELRNGVRRQVEPMSQAPTRSRLCRRICCSTISAFG